MVTLLAICLVFLNKGNRGWMVEDILLSSQSSIVPHIKVNKVERRVIYFCSILPTVDWNINARINPLGTDEQSVTENIPLSERYIGILMNRGTISKMISSIQSPIYRLLWSFFPRLITSIVDLSTNPLVGNSYCHDCIIIDRKIDSLNHLPSKDQSDMTDQWLSIEESPAMGWQVDLEFINRWIPIFYW